MDNGNENYYRTKDFYHSSLLRALGFELNSLDRSQTQFVTFVFRDPENKARDVIDRYWNKKVNISARLIFEAIRELKTRLYLKT